jgi:hypothetical protein
MLACIVSDVYKLQRPTTNRSTVNGVIKLEDQRQTKPKVPQWSVGRQMINRQQKESSILHRSLGSS